MNCPGSVKQIIAIPRCILGMHVAHAGLDNRVPSPCLQGRESPIFLGGRFWLVLEWEMVAQFVIEREIPGAGALSEAEIREISLRSLQTLKEMGPQIQWLHSYVTEEKVYCVYLAPDENTIREHARRTGIPADRISAVRQLIDPANLA